MDPLVLVATLAAVKTWIPALLAGALVLGLTVLLGRFFCGYVCPMGVVIDVADHCAGHGKGPVLARKEAPIPPGFRRFKHWFLIFILVAALMGVSFVFLGSPLSLVTRFFALVVYPVIGLLTEAVLSVLRPLADAMDWRSVYFAQVRTARYSTVVFVTLFFMGVFAMARFTPRFWCRYLCPAGALMALFSLRPLVGRRVNDKCIDCGKCQPGQRAA